MNGADKKLIKLLKSIPDLAKGFTPLSEWKEINFDDQDREAFYIFQEKLNVPDIENINNFNKNDAIRLSTSCAW